MFFFFFLFFFATGYPDINSPVSLQDKVEYKTPSKVSLLNILLFFTVLLVIFFFFLPTCHKEVNDIGLKKNHSLVTQSND